MKNSFQNQKRLKEKALKEAKKIKDSGPLPNEMIENPNFRKQFQAASTVLKKTPVKKSSRPNISSDRIPTEGTRWAHTLQEQTKERTKIFTKKLSRQHLR